MDKIRLFAQNVASGDKYELFPTKGKFTERINQERRADFSFMFPKLAERAAYYGLTVFEMLFSVLTDIWIERDGVKIFLGAIDKPSIDPDFNKKLMLKVTAIDYFGMLAKRIVGVPLTVYTNTDAGEIIWDAIDTSQNSNTPYSDWGITEGSIDASANHDRTCRFKKIYDLAIGLSNAEISNGIDIEITPDKEFNAYYPTKGQSRPNLIFTPRNTSDWSWEKTGLMELTNKVHVQGEAMNDYVTYATRNASNSYKDPYGLLESVLNESDTKVAAHLEAKGDRLLAEQQEGEITFTLSHYDSVIGWHEYNVGDTVVVDFPQLGMVRATKRVMERTFNWNEDGVTIDVKFK